MADDDAIYVDASQPVTLRYPGGSVELSLQDAVIARNKLPTEYRDQATIEVNIADGLVYTAQEIDRLHYEPKPTNQGGGNGGEPSG
jgi:hypothetical protein